MLSSDCSQTELALGAIQNTAQAAPEALTTSDGRISDLHLLQLELLLEQGSQTEFLQDCLEPLRRELQGRVRDKSKTQEPAEPPRTRKRYVAIGLASMEVQAVCKLVVCSSLRRSF